MKEVEKLIESLHPLERAILPVLGKNKDVNSIKEATNLKEVEITRALGWLEAKNIVKLKKETKEIISLGDNGKIYVKKGLPERRFLEVLKTPLSLDEIKDKADLNEDELKVCIGLLKSRNAINLGKEIEITHKGKDLILKETLDDSFLKSLPLEVSKLNPSQKSIYNELKKRRGIIKTEPQTVLSGDLTELGNKIAKSKLETNLVDALTTTIIKSGEWKEKKFRRYNLSLPVPRVYAGRRHFVNEAVDYIKRVWLDMGFKEMTGPLLDVSFWNFDALFTPQDHPAREMQDTFFVDGLGKLPEAKIVNAVKNEHEKIWKYKWDANKARELVLRTHTTILSARTLASLKQSDLPAKFFSVGRVFRNEALDWSHLFELTQVEGIVIDPNANFRHLIGYLRQFYNKLGFDKVRIRPSYFPYVEPGLEVEVWHPVKKKWIELGGAGILRPEVVKPLLGKDVPVLAWGQGMERGISEYFNITDIRDLYKNDLKQLREMKAWLK